MSDTDRDHLVTNIALHAGVPEVTAEMKARVTDYWRNVHPDLGARVGKELNEGRPRHDPGRAAPLDTLARSAAPPDQVG